MSTYIILTLFVVIFVNSGFASRIVNGTDADIADFPYTVSLRNSRNGNHRCGASILNPMWILTAAHCVVSANARSINIQYGVTDINPKGPNVINISRIIVHPGYFPPNNYINDIALLRLTEPVKLGTLAQTVRLPKSGTVVAGNTSATLVGWGYNRSGGSIQDHLQKVDLMVYSNEECSKRHRQMMHKSNMCAGVDGGGKGQCSGDSGGPLIVNNTQVGIVSWSRKPCAIAPYPGVFTRVSSYIDWMMKSIEEDLNISDWNLVNLRPI